MIKLVSGFGKPHFAHSHWQCVLGIAIEMWKICNILADPTFNMLIQRLVTPSRVDLHVSNCINILNATFTDIK